MYNSRRKIFQKLKSSPLIGTSKLARALAKVFMPLPKSPVWIETKYGFELKVDPFKDKGVERNLFYFGVYEPGTLETMKMLLKPGSCFVDVGANIGLMSIMASKLVGNDGSVFSFEPNPKTNEILQENVDRNNIQNIKVEALALGSETKSTRIYDRWDANRGAATLIKPDYETSSHEISQSTLEAYFEGNQAISLMKIDVEGFELEVLNGGKQIFKNSTAPMLIIECSTNRENTFGDSVRPLYEFITAINAYRIFKLESGKNNISKLVEVKRFEDLPFHDNIFCITENIVNTLSKNLFK